MLAHETNEPDINHEFRAMYDGLGVLVWITRDDGVLVHGNDAWHAYVGSLPGTTLGTVLTDHVHPADRATLHTLQQSLYSGPHEVRLRRHDGQYRWFELRVRLGAPADRHGGVGTATDVHDRRVAHDRLGHLLDVSRQLSAPTRTDVVLDVIARTGTTATDATGVTVLWRRGGALYPSEPGTPPLPLDADDPAAHAAREERPHTGTTSGRAALAVPIRDAGRLSGVVRFEFGQAHAPGPIQPAEREYLETLAGLYGKALESARAHETRARARAMLDLAWYGSPSAIAVLDTDLRYVQVNAAMAELNETPAPEHAGRTPAEVHPDFGNAVEAMLGQVLETGEAVANVPIPSPDADVEGGWRYWLVSFHPVRVPGGPLEYLGVVAVDMTREILAEEALRDSERRFRMIAEGSSDLVACHAPDGTFVYASPSFERQLGYAPAELVGRSPLDLIDPDDADIFWQGVAGAARGDAPGPFVYRARSRDGHLLWLESNAQIIRDEDGQVTEIQSTTRNITERKETELALRFSRQQLELALQAGKLGMWDYDFTTGRNTFSGLTTALFGLPGDLQDFGVELFYSLIHPDDVGRVRARIHAALAHGGEYSDEYRVLHPDGQERWLRAVGHVTRHADGSPGRMTGVHYDVTDRHAAERERAELAQLVQESSDLIVMCSFDRRVLYLNAAGLRMLGMDALPPEGLRSSELLWSEDLDLLDRDVYPALLVHGRWTGDVRFVHAVSGQPVPVSANYFVIRDPHTGLPLALAGVCRDVSERQHAEAEIRQLNATLEQRVRERTRRVQELHAELSAFATSVSRDIQEPLRRISGFVKLLEKRLGEDVDARTAEYLRYIGADGSRVARLVEDLQSFARFGRDELRLAEIQLDPLVAQVRSDLDAFTRGRRIEWTVPPLPCVRGDSMLLRQAVAALLDNAIKFTRPRDVAHIEIGAREEGREIVVWVRDDGVGFPATESARLFNVFQRLHDDRFGGAGVGLANVRRIITRHGGRVWAESEEGRGATFYFSLPNYSS